MDEGVIFSELVDEYTPSIPDLSDVLGTCLDFVKQQKWAWRFSL
jgi:hypothetical protein